MNANELADKLEGTAKFINNISNQYHAVREVKEAATMLRDQQAEIEALKSILEQEGIGVGRDLLNGGIALLRKAQEK